MKTFKITLLAALISAPLAAESLDDTWEIGVFGDYIKSSTNKEYDAAWKNIDAGKGLGIDLQKIINEQWNARIELASDYYDIDHAHDIDFGTRFGIDAIYKFEDSDFYLFSGVKRFNNARSYFAVDVGAGYSHKINEDFSVYSEAVVYRDIEHGYTDQGLKIGLKYTFGDVKKVPVAKKAKPVVNTLAQVVEQDDDNDGVFNSVDRCKDTPANIKVDATGCTLYADKAAAINLNVAFENNSSQVKSNVVNEIERLADFMKAYSNTSTLIEGHSSAVGGNQYNLVLSKKRADAVKDILVNTFNIDASRITTKGFGETQLLSQGNTKADHSVNRRVIAKIETTVKEAVSK